MKSFPTEHFSLLYCFIIILLHYYNISVFPSKYKKIQGEIKSCKNSSGYFFPMHMEVEWVIGAGSWVRKIQTQGCSTPYIPIGKDLISVPYMCVYSTPHLHKQLIFPLAVSLVADMCDLSLPQRDREDGVKRIRAVLPDFVLFTANAWCSFVGLSLFSLSFPPGSFGHANHFKRG